MKFTAFKFPLLSLKNTAVFTIVSLLLFLFSALISYFLLLSANSNKSMAVNEPGLFSEVFQSTPTPDPMNSFNLLLLGYGGTGHSGGMLSDMLMVINVDPKLKKIVFISVPRDTWVELPVAVGRSEKHKINDAFAIGGDHNKYPEKELRYRNVNGGGEMVKYAVEVVTGLPIRYYAAVDFRGFENLVDVLGGLDVNVPVTFDDYFYPVKGLEDLSCDKSAEEIARLTTTLSGFELEKQFTCRYEHLHFDSGITHMDGVTALKFVRSRHSDQHGGDFARSARQQAVLLAVRDRLFSMDALNKSDEYFEKLSGYVKTDFDKAALSYTLTLPGSLYDYKIKSINLSTGNVFVNARSGTGQYILIPEAGEGGWGTIHEFIKKEITVN